MEFVIPKVKEVKRIQCAGDNDCYASGKFICDGCQKYCSHDCMSNGPF